MYTSKREKEIIEGSKVIFLKVLLFIAFILFLGFAWLFWEAFLKNVIPYTKTNFKDYNEFVLKADYFFPKDMPTSAIDVKYYYFSGNMDKLYGVSFEIEDTEYEEVKQNFIMEYVKSDIEEVSQNEDDVESESSVILTETFIQEEKITFIDQILRESYQNYSVIVYENKEIQKGYYKTGVFCNDDTHEIVIISMEDVMFNEKN